MKIERINVKVLELPYKKPLVTAATRFDTAKGILVRVDSSDGSQGFGYSDIFDRTGETIESARYAIERFIKPTILGRDLRDWVQIRKKIDQSISGNLRAKIDFQ